MPGVQDTTAVVSRRVAASPEAVWAVLSDGWLYPLWVVGASRMRDVDAGWPAVGTRLHHSVGSWPLLLDDRTEVLEVVEGELLRLRAHAWPSGAAEVLLTLEADGAGTTVSIREDAAEGPAVLVPGPVRQLGIVPRNKEALRRLALLAEGRASA